MTAKQIATILIVSIAFLALLGCVKQLPTGSGNELSGEQDPIGGQPGGLGEELVGPEYYDSEAEALAALDEELEAIGELSSDDLEALLGE